MVVTVCIMALRLTLIDCPPLGGVVAFRHAHTVETSLKSGTFRELLLLTGSWMSIGGAEVEDRKSMLHLVKVTVTCLLKWKYSALRLGLSPLN